MSTTVPTKPLPANLAAQPVNTQLASVLGQAVSAFDDAVLLLSTEPLSLHWYSATAEKLLPTLATDGVNAITVRMAPAMPDVLNQLQEAGTANSIDVTLLASGEQPRMHCTVCCIDNDWLAIRINDKRDNVQHLQTYMEEREKLFTTSRTISVSEMATTLAHELNQPIGTVSNILKGIKSRLAKHPDGMDEIITALDRAVDQSQFAARIISRIRDFTQSRQPSRKDCNIFTLLEQSVDLLDWVVDKADVSVSLTPPEQPIVVNGDTTMLQQVFTNLIRNAVDSMRESEAQQRKLALSVILRDGDAQVEIADTGHGLSKTAENNLFVPFVTQKSQGMGVGLNICRSFVELHQGRLWLAQNDSGGCTAFVVLPVARAGG